jgi:hypothetical protein
MLLLIIVAMATCAAFGLPLLPVLVVGACAMLIASYIVSRLDSVRNLGLGFGMFVLPHLIVHGIIGQSPEPFQMPAWVAWIFADATLGAVSVVIICAAAFLGIFGVAGKPHSADLAEALARVKQREQDQKEGRK